jgi:hypothetical protein
MKHADSATLAQLAPLLSQVRGLPGLVERRPGVFYRRSKAFLHFHQDPAGVFADVRLDGAEFQRFPVNTPGEQAALLQTLAVTLPG